MYTFGRLLSVEKDLKGYQSRSEGSGFDHNSVGYGVDCTPGNGICPNLARIRVGKENDDIRDSDERSSGCGILPIKLRKCGIRRRL